jgi:hypothetical protein
MGGDAIVSAARALGDRVRGLVWADTFRSLGDAPTSSAEDVAGFVAPFHADFAAAVDRDRIDAPDDGTSKSNSTRELGRRRDGVVHVATVRERRSIRSPVKSAINSKSRST